MDLTRLRKETSSEHASTEETVPVMSPTLTRDEYVRILQSFYRIVKAWDLWSDAHAPADLLPLMAGRRRAELLEDDIRLLEDSTPEPRDVPLARLEDTVVMGDPRSAFLGRMYVMEGSTLGGQYIARHVEETLGLLHGQGNSYFVGYGEQTSTRWQQFRVVLGALPDTETETVIASAKNMFALFGEAMRLTGTTVTNRGMGTPLANVSADSGDKVSIRT